MFKNTSYNRFSIIVLLMLVLSLIVMPTLAQTDPDPEPEPVTCDQTLGRVILDAAPVDSGLSASIAIPEDCSEVPPAPTGVDIEGVNSDEADGSLWVLIYTGEGTYYPQSVEDVDAPDACTPDELTEATDETWATVGYFGADDSAVPQEFHVVLVYADADASAFFADWWSTQCETPGSAGIDPLGWDGVVYELDFHIVYTSNDLCSFTPGEDVTVPEDTDYSEEWATNILGAGFSTTVVSIDANPELFAVDPAVDSDGILSFSPSEEAFGIATVSVVLVNEAGEDCQEEELIITVLPVNDPPVCDEAVGDPDMLWPPNHRMESISVTGVTDVDSTIFVYNFDEVTSDEPENGLGDGNTAPDIIITDTTLETGEATQELQVRSERSGLGDGREYTVAFTVDDVDFTPDLGPFTIDDVINEEGSNCSSDFVVFVPHDMRGGLALNGSGAADDEGDEAGLSLGLTEAGVGATTILFDAPADEAVEPTVINTTPVGK